VNKALQSLLKDTEIKAFNPDGSPREVPSLDVK
jgi:hypothetical protein